MYYLLDTHVCIWAIEDQNKLSVRVKEILENTDNGFFVSKMSFFEIAIKLKIGKLPDFNVSLSEFIDATYRSGYNTLAIKDEHFKTYSETNFNDTHRDPFDRYLLATAHNEGLSLITKDEKFNFYKKDHPIIWRLFTLCPKNILFQHIYPDINGSARGVKLLRKLYF